MARPTREEQERAAYASGQVNLAQLLADADDLECEAQEEADTFKELYTTEQRHVEDLTKELKERTALCDSLGDELQELKAKHAKTVQFCRDTLTKK